jgi:hypothetical protein
MRILGLDLSLQMPVRVKRPRRKPPTPRMHLLKVRDYDKWHSRTACGSDAWRDPDGPDDYVRPEATRHRVTSDHTKVTCKSCRKRLS